MTTRTPTRITSKAALAESALGPELSERRAALAVLAAATVVAACKSTPMPPDPSPPAPSAPAPGPVPAPRASDRYPLVSNMLEYRRRAAQIIIAAHPGMYYTGNPPELWPGICTVTVTLNADGSIRGVDLMRASKVSPEVNQRALEIVRRSANFGPVNNLPSPWQFNETFLFTNSGQFALDTLLSKR